LLFVLFVAANAFSLYTVFVAGFSNALLAIGMITYAALTWLFGSYILLKRKTP
jgi:hypothetical protein